MAHFALLDENNVVVNVIVVHNNDVNNLPFPESEPVGIAFLTDLYKQERRWKQTSYNRNFRKNYAMIGGTYDPEMDIFTEAQPYPSWSLNRETGLWYAPTPKPQDGKWHTWDEATLSWIEVPE
jgi:hypothetical protein